MGQALKGRPNFTWRHDPLDTMFFDCTLLSFKMQRIFPSLEYIGILSIYLLFNQMPATLFILSLQLHVLHCLKTAFHWVLVTKKAAFPIRKPMRCHSMQELSNNYVFSKSTLYLINLPYVLFSSTMLYFKNKDLTIFLNKSLWLSCRNQDR